MKLFEEFAAWFKEKDQQLMELHTMKEAELLAKTYKSLEEEHLSLIEYLHRIERLVEMAEQYVNIETIDQERPMKSVPNFEKWYYDLESKLNKLFTGKKRSLNKKEQEIITMEFSTLQAEKHRLEKRIHKFHEIMAKTRLLLDDLDEDSAKKLARGHTLAAVGEVLLKKFSREFREDYGQGRKDIRRFLEDHYEIDNHTSRELFYLLERKAILRFTTELPANFKNKPLVYYPSEIGNTMEDFTGISPDIFGLWEINA